jgi:hypothetical protein
MTPTDDEIRAMLAARASRERVGGSQGQAILASATRLAAAEPRERRRRFGVAGPLRRFAGAAASLLAASLVLALVAVPLANRPPASAIPSVGPSIANAPSPPAPTPTAMLMPEAQVLTPQELGSLVESRGAELAGFVVAAEGKLMLDPSVLCARGTVCGNTILAGAGASFLIKPVGDIGPGPWDGSGPKSGTFALRITDNLGDGGRTIVEYLGNLLPAADGLARSVGDLLAGEAREEAGYVAVRAWLVRTPLHPCPSIPAAPGNGIVANWPRYGCPSDDYLTDERYQPLRADGSSLGPQIGSYLYLPSGAYDEWAPDPTAFGLGVEPREATYLLAWRAVAPCGPLADCYVGPEHFHWLMQGRLDPIPGQPR